MRRVFIALLFSVLVVAEAHLDHSHSESDEVYHQHPDHSDEEDHDHTFNSLQTEHSHQNPDLCSQGSEEDRCTEYSQDSHHTLHSSEEFDLGLIEDQLPHSDSYHDSINTHSTHSSPSPADSDKPSKAESNPQKLPKSSSDGKEKPKNKIETLERDSKDYGKSKKLSQHEDEVYSENVQDEYPQYVDLLVRFAVSIESYLASAYTFIREKKPYNIVAFYIVFIYMFIKLFSANSRKSQVSFSYKVVDERAQDAIMQTISKKFEDIEKKLAELKDVKPIVQPVVHPSPRQTPSGNVPDIQPKLDQISSHLNKLLEWQEEFQTEIVDSHKQIWEELHNIYNTRPEPEVRADYVPEPHVTPQLHAPKEHLPEVDLPQYIPEVTSHASYIPSKSSSEQVSNVTTPSMKPLVMSNPPPAPGLLSELPPKDEFQVRYEETKHLLDDSVESDKHSDTHEEKIELKEEPILLAEPSVRAAEVVEIRKIPPVRLVGNPGRGRGIVPIPKRKEPEGLSEDAPGRAKFVAPANISTNPFGFKA